MRIQRYRRFWAVYEESGALLCLCVYKKGAEAILARLLPPEEFLALPARGKRGSVETRYAVPPPGEQGD